MQRLLRRGADQPQIQMAQNYASAIAAASNLAPSPGMSPASAELRAIMIESSLVPPRHLDLSTTLEPFVILYDTGGKPLSSTGNLDGAIPTPPAGVFAYLRTHPADKFTWQPRPGLRIAAVAQRIDARRIDGSPAGFHPRRPLARPGPAAGRRAPPRHLHHLVLPDGASHPGAVFLSRAQSSAQSHALGPASPRTSLKRSVAVRESPATSSWMVWQPASLRGFAAAFFAGSLRRWLRGRLASALAFCRRLHRSLLRSGFFAAGFAATFFAAGFAAFFAAFTGSGFFAAALALAATLPRLGRTRHRRSLRRNRFHRRSFSRSGLR